MNEMDEKIDDSEQQAEKKLGLLQNPLVAAIFVGAAWFLGTSIGGYWGTGRLPLAEAVLSGLVSAVITYAITDWRNRKSVS